MDALLYEIQSIDKELGNLRKTCGNLNKRKKELTDNVISVMKDKNITECEYKGTKYIIKEYKHAIRKGTKKRYEDMLNILNLNGFYGEDAEKIYINIVTASKGPETTTTKLQPTKRKDTLLKK